MKEFEDFKKKYEFEKYEQTSCLIYEMYIRAEKIKKEDLNIDASFDYFLNVPIIKDIYLYSSNTNEVTLQNIIYNIYPELYIDTVIYITQFYISQLLININSNLSKIEIEKEIIAFFLDFEKCIKPDYNRFSPQYKYFEMDFLNKLIQYKNKINDIKNNIDFKNDIDSYKLMDEINNIFEKIPKHLTYKSYEKLSENIKNISHNSIYESIRNDKLHFYIIDTCIENIIARIFDVQQHFEVHLNDDIEIFKIETFDLHEDIKKQLKKFSFPLNYLENEYLNKEEKHFIPQLIESPYDNSYIRITKKYVQDLIKNYLLNFRITPNFKRPIFELNKISPLTTLHNINLSLPIEELTSYMQNLKDSHNKALNVEEKTKYEIIYNKETINVEKHLTDLETAVKILYIYDYPLSKKKIEKNEIKIWTKLKISRSTYYLFKKIGTTYIDEKKYLELYNGKRINNSYK